MEQQLPDYDETKRVLDLDNLEKEKRKLIDLIKPAIDQFHESTGFYPSISVVITTMSTKCATIETGGGLQISISI